MVGGVDTTSITSILRPKVTRSLSGDRLLGAWLVIHGMTQTDLAAELGTGQSAISELCRGGRRLSTLRTAIAERTGVPVDAWDR